MNRQETSRTVRFSLNSTRWRRGPALVGQADPHDGDGQQAGLFLHDVGHGEGQEDHRQGGGAVQRVGNPDRAKGTISRPAPSRPMPPPTTAVRSSATAASAAPPVPAAGAGDDEGEQASVAPSGSMTMPSHFSTAPARPPRRRCRRMGAITVGPVTTRMAASSAASGQSKPSRNRAAMRPTSQVTTVPIVVSRSRSPPMARSSRTLRPARP